MTEVFQINGELDLEALTREFARNHRVSIKHFLARGADRLYELIVSRKDWSLTMNANGKHYEFDHEAQCSMSSMQMKVLELQALAGARSNFQFRYLSVRIPDDRAARLASEDIFPRFAAWMSTGEPLDVLRRVTGNQDVAFADAQVTAYGPGDFLTLHDDAAPATKRTAAYVFGLTKDWRADWGGALLFHDAANLVGWAPEFNVLNLFAVPQPHSVSLVSAAAAGRRFSVSGWLRRI